MHNIIDVELYLCMLTDHPNLNFLHVTVNII